jgi:hypothetical protein
MLDDDVSDRRRLRCVSKEGWDPRFRDGGSNEEEDKDDEDGNGDRDEDGN